MSHKAQSNQRVTASEPEGAVGSKIETEVQPGASSGEKESSVQPCGVRGIVFSRIPGHEHLHFLSARDIVRFDTAMSARGEREHLLESYANMRSAGFDEHVYSDANDFEGLRWVRKREVDVRSLKLEYKGERDVDQVLGRLVVDENEDMASYYALRSEARDVLLSKLDGVRDVRSTTLIKASERGYLAVVRCLLERGADVNKANNDGQTPLYWASYEWALGGGQGPACSPGRREQGR